MHLKVDLIEEKKKNEILKKICLDGLNFDSS